MNVAGATSATVTGLAQGTNYYWQVQGDEYRRRHGGGQRRLADVRDPARPDPACGLLEDLAGERRAEPALAGHAQVGGERGRNRVPVVHLDRQRDVHV